MSKIPQFIIAAPTSNSGKTTITLGLLRALGNRGLLTQPFKVGPDYIDPKFHKVACGQVGVNLDSYMMTEDDIHQTYAAFSKNKGAVCIEGVMGLFDGARKSEGSTAAMSKLLKIPVILVVDAKSVAYSVAPLLYGFINFDPEVIIAGVIFNRVNTESHYQFLKEACEDVGIRSFGYVPYIADCEIPSRHLGLSIEEMEHYAPMIDTIAQAMEKTVAISDLIACCLLTTPEYCVPSNSVSQKTVEIAVANDEAFNFSYVQNIVALKELGNVTFFSPLHDRIFPICDLLYLPGGYPEFYLKTLSANSRMRTAIKSFALGGGKIIAECGGMMYLGKEIKDEKGEKYKMCGFFDFSATMKDMKLSLGYRTICIDTKVLKGHEFHYSKIIKDAGMPTKGTVINARKQSLETKIYRCNNVWASYIHVYFGTKELLEVLLNELEPSEGSLLKTAKTI